MVAPETVPAVEAKKRPGPQAGQPQEPGKSRRRSWEVRPLHARTTSAAAVVGHDPHEEVDVVRLDGQL